MVQLQVRNNDLPLHLPAECTTETPTKPASKPATRAAARAGKAATSAGKRIASASSSKTTLIAPSTQATANAPSGTLPPLNVPPGPTQTTPTATAADVMDTVPASVPSPSRTPPALLPLPEPAPAHQNAPMAPNQGDMAMPHIAAAPLPAPAQAPAPMFAAAPPAPGATAPAQLPPTVAHPAVHVPPPAAQLNTNITHPPFAVMPSTVNTPRLQGVTLDDVMKNHHPGQRSQWEAQASKCLVLPFDPGHSPAGSVTCILPLQNAIRNILHLAVDPKIGSPAHEKPTFAATTPPHFYLLGGLTDAQMNTLTAAQVWSTEAISFFVLPFLPPPTRYTASYNGLSLPNTAQSISTVEAGLRGTINADGRIRSLVANYHDNITAYSTPQAAVASLTADLSVTAWDTPEGVIWNLYIDPPTTVANPYAQWLDLLSDIRMASCYDGCTTHVSIRRCTRCLSLDHAPHQCPFPLLPGWLGPAPLSPPAQPDATRGRGRGSHRAHAFRTPRGARGRGF